MWDWGFVIQVFPEILRAMWITLSVTVSAFFFAVVAGLILAILRRFKIRTLSWTVAFLVEFVRGTPPLVQLFFVFYVLPLYGISLTPFTAGVLALGIHYSTYCSEIYRSGIDAVPRGQWEAATALNFSGFKKWTRVILPQAIPPIIPMLGNYLIAMFKDTPLLSAITLVEMLQAAKIIGAESFRYLEPITIVGFLFLLLSYPSSVLVRHLEERMNRRYAKNMENMSATGKDVVT